ncbi:MAG: class I SAM-dependent methyltransferase [Candidatus Woesearchaeota archaeon]
MWEKLVNKLLEKSEVKLGEDIIIDNKSAYRDFILKGSLGFGESYMEGKWDSPHLDVLVAKILNAQIEQNRFIGTLTDNILRLRSVLLNLQTKKYAPDLYETHYNAGNHLFESFLDENMIYTCAYFQNTDDLTQAQLDKIKIVGEKLHLQPEDNVLDIGCGWGGTARILSEMFGCRVTGVSNTPNQIIYALEHNSHDRVRFFLSDYRDIDGIFNKIYNIGFLEAVGPKNFRGFMELVDKNLDNDGIFLTHTIGSMESVECTDPWLDKYIFPHGVIPSRVQIDNSVRGIFEERDFEAFGEYYDTTLMNWNQRFNDNWDSIKHNFKHPDEFKRMMNYYFLICAASFRVGKNDLWHLVYTKPGHATDYQTYRLPIIK